ncbi:Hermansky-Pudlak syndrome 1 protein [Haematobia irritans]|uniref:Hermansky-Pudlak syndrome 1 protein n=1 Tax=Haematobia irritans TaxID=7368 RepID=UPI003F4FEA3B
MNGLIVFNNANDVVYQRFNKVLQIHLLDKAIDHGLLPEDFSKDSCGPKVDQNVLVQLFSPIINSQRIMHCQFDNCYSSIQCEEDLNLVFGEVLGYQFISIAQDKLELMQRKMGVVMALAKHLYGPNLFASDVQEELFSKCMECYEDEIYDTNLILQVESLPRLLINAELKRAVKGSLDRALDCLRDGGHMKCHVLMFVGVKFLAVNSSKTALPLSPSDLLFLALLIRALQRDSRGLNKTMAIFLQGIAQDPQSGCVPCIAHLNKLNKGVVLIQLVEYPPLTVASSLYDTFFVLQKIISIQMQGDAEALKPTYESLESFVRQSLDALKKVKLKGDDVESCTKKFSAKWENLKKMYNEFLKTYERDLVVRIESNIPSFLEDLKLLFTLTCCDSSSVNFQQLPEVASVVEGKLLEFAEFLAVKAERNVTIEAYLDDFPGLIHFIYINRSSGLMISPDLKTSNPLIPSTKLFEMLEFSRRHLKKGHSSLMWKDKTFNYAYFLWFEDQSTGSSRSIDLEKYLNLPSANSANSFKPNFEPGLLAGDYYQLLTEICFPKTPVNKIKCYELFLVHLGLVTATCAVEHARRLVATIADVVGDDTF